MKLKFIKTGLVVVVISSLIFGPLNNVFVKKAEAEESFGATVGKAIGAGIACFAGFYGESYLLSKESEWSGTLTESSPVSGALAFTALLTDVPAFDRTNYSVTQEQNIKNRINTSMDKSKDCIRDVVAKIIIDWIVDQTIEWIQGKGEPKFVTDWGDFLSDAFQSGVGTVINESNFRFLCSPFRPQVRLTLLPVKSFKQRVECTLDDVVENIEDFYNDFSKGGWLAYNEMWQPQNNYYGQTLMFYNEAMMKGLAVKEAAQDEAAAGKGFLSVKRCQEYDLEDPPEEYKNCIQQPEGSHDKCKKYACVKWETHTPGYIVGEAAAEAMTSDSKWAYNIRGWIASLINAVINRLTTEAGGGLGYMKTSREKPTGYGTKDYKGDFNPTQDGELTKITAEQYKDALEKKIAESTGKTIIENYRKILTDRKAILTYKQSSLSYVQQIISIYDQLKDKGCPAAQSDIDAAKKAQDELNTKITELQSQIREIEANLAEAESIPPAKKEGEHTDEWRKVVEKYTEFITNKYPNILTETYSGSVKSKAKEEADKWSGKLNDAQTKLDNCAPTTQ